MPSPSFHTRPLTPRARTRPLTPRARTRPLTPRAGRGWQVAGLLLAVGLWGACREQAPLVAVEGRLRVSEDSLGFGATYVGGEREARLRVENAGRAALGLRWEQVPAPFAAQGLPERLEATGAVEVRVRFLPEAPGPYEAVLAGVEEGGRRVEVRLVGEARPVPECPTPVTCHRFVFDLQAERCVEQVLEDGSECDPGNACVVEARCESGRCRGRERVCSDGNACTRDVCNPLDGCRAVPGPPCPGDGRCQEGWCDPQRGCLLRPAADGTFCGPRRGCDLADVCVEGECVERDLPDGFVCAQASPCQGEGRCRGVECQRPPAAALTPDWQYDGQLTGRQMHDLMVGPEGEIILAGFFTPPLLDAAGPGQVTATVSARRCALWNDRLLCMDVPESGQVSLLDRSTGAPRWTFDFARARPDFAARTSTLFMARLAVIAPDRLAALFEAYPEGADRSTLCRRYFLVVLDAFGRMVSAQALEDELLAECNHPHPYGVVADATGDLHIAFAPTLNSAAPLVAGSPTLLMAFSPEGVARWRKRQAQKAGELGAVRGLLLQEHSGQVLSKEEGEPMGSVPGVVGRAVATWEVVVPSPPGTSLSADAGIPPPGAAELKGYRLPGLEPAWSYRVPGGGLFVSKEIRLASWEQKGQAPETVVAGFAVEGGTQPVPVLVGLRAKDGSEAFRCPVGYTPRTAPQLWELGPGSLVLMDGAATCGECDPPFANSRGRFLRLPVPGLGPAEEPWPGTFGGPGHDHREQPAGGSR